MNQFERFFEKLKSLFEDHRKLKADFKDLQDRLAALESKLG